MIQRLTRAWFGYWFAPSAPTDLALARVTFFLGVLLTYWNEDFRDWGSVSPAFWMPIPAFAWLQSHLHLGPASAGTLGVLQAAWRIALLLSACGLFGRVTLPSAAILSFYLLGLPHNYGHTYHFDALLVLVMFVLAGSKACDAGSLDAWRAARTNGRPAPRLSGEYTWPIRLVWWLMAAVFVAAGLSKLRHGGLEWVWSDNMSLLLMKAMYHVSDADPLTTAGLTIARHPWASRTLAAVALVTELGFITAPFSRRARAFFVPAAAVMLVAIRVLMGPTFGGFLVANVFWIPWQALGVRLRQWSAWSDTRDFAATPPPGSTGETPAASRRPAWRAADDRMR